LHPARGASLFVVGALVAGGLLALPAPRTTTAADMTEPPSHSPTCPPAPGPTAGPYDPAWWRREPGTIYETFVRSFRDSSGDGVGDLVGITTELPYLRDLGVRAIWLMPVFPSPSYHGYDVTSYANVNPDYGDVESLNTLIEGAHQYGIKVLLDLPLNHTSDQDPWFVASRDPGSSKRDWYVWADKPQGNNWYPLGGSYYYAAFGPTFPDLNLRNPDVTREVTDDVERWMRPTQFGGVDGFRLDAAKYLIEDGAKTENTPETHQWWNDFRTAIDSAAAHNGTDDPLTVGEVWDTPQTSSSYVPDDLDMTFDFGYAGALINAVNSADGATLGRVMTKVTGLYPPGAFGAFLTNHDMPRLANQVGGDATREHEAAALLLLGPGTPFVYYGEELGMSGDKPDPQIRAPMRWNASQPSAGFSSAEPWEVLSADPASVNVADEAADPDSLLNWYRQLIAFRNGQPMLTTGTFASVTAKDRAVVAELRSGTFDPYGGSLLVLANLGDQDLANEPLSIPAASLCGAPLATVVFGNGGPVMPVALNAAGGFDDWVPFATLPAHSVTVISLSSR
jgi:alpha-amylase